MAIGFQFSTNFSSAQMAVLSSMLEMPNVYSTWELGCITLVQVKKCIFFTLIALLPSPLSF